MLINLQLLCTKKNVGSATCLPDVYPVIMGMACSVSDVHFLPSGFHIQLQREFLNRRPSFLFTSFSKSRSYHSTRNGPFEDPSSCRMRND
jgi:hypothetical protein